MRARLTGAFCTEHGFGRNRYGQAEYETHIAAVVRTVTDLKAKARGREVFPDTDPAPLEAS